MLHTIVIRALDPAPAFDNLGAFIPVVCKVYELHYRRVLLFSGLSVRIVNLITDGGPVVAEDHIVETAHLHVNGLEAYVHGHLVLGQGETDPVDIVDGVLRIEDLAPVLPGVIPGIPGMKTVQEPVLHLLLKRLFRRGFIGDGEGLFQFFRRNIVHGFQFNTFIHRFNDLLLL